MGANVRMDAVCANQELSFECLFIGLGADPVITFSQPIDELVRVHVNILVFFDRVMQDLNQIGAMNVVVRESVAADNRVTERPGYNRAATPVVPDLSRQWQKADRSQSLFHAKIVQHSGCIGAQLNTGARLAD